MTYNPIPFRKLDYINQFKKYDRVEIDLTKNSKDFRPESFRPVDIDADEPIKVVEHIGTENNILFPKALNEVDVCCGSCS